MTLDTLLDEVVRAHFPRPPATAERIAAFEERMGWRLDADLRAFYLRCDGAELFKPLPDSNPFDAYHETYPREVRRIAESFQEFLSRALRGSGHLYWLE